MPAPSGEASAEVLAVSERNSFPEREQDLLRICQEGPFVRDTVRCPTVELKHSAPRVLPHLSATHKHTSLTSCLLPSSKIMIWPPAVKEARYLTGPEALAIQGIPPEYDEATGQVCNDSLYMSLAGNAFNGDCFALIFLAGLAVMKIPQEEEEEEEFPEVGVEEDAFDMVDAGLAVKIPEDKDQFPEGGVEEDVLDMFDDGVLFA